MDETKIRARNFLYRKYKGKQPNTALIDCLIEFNYEEKLLTFNYDVVTKLIGPIKPVGESREDHIRLKNLEALTLLVSQLLIDIDEVEHENIKSSEHSRKQSAKVAGAFLDKIGIVNR